MKVAVISFNKEQLKIIERLLKEKVAFECGILLHEGGLEILEQVVGQEMPDMMIMDGICKGMDGLDELEQFCEKYPSIAIILLSHDVSPAFLISAMHIGVRDVLQLPLVPEALQAAIARIERKGPINGGTAKKGKVVAFISCKGGSGSTFLAANLGYILAMQGVKVALLDLNLQFGDAALFVYDQVPQYSVADVAGENISRLDASFLDSSMVKVLPNFSVLAAPEDPGRSGEVSAENIEVLINLVKSEYDYVILDLGRILNGVSLKALDQTDILFPVMQVTLPFIRDAKRIINGLEALGIPMGKIKLIINRYEKGEDIKLKDVERTIGIKAYKTVPNSYKAVSASVNQGVPIVKTSEHDAVTQALCEIASDLTGGQQQKKDTGWFSRLFEH